MASRSPTRRAIPATSTAPNSPPTSTGSSGSAGSSAGLKRARIGSIGARTGAFQTMRFSEKLLQASGLTVVTVDLSEIIFAANALADDAPEVKAKLEEIAAYGRIPSTHQAGKDRSAGQVDARSRSLDRRERMRRERDPVLAQPAGQFRLRDLPDHEHDGREADAERLRGRRHGRDLDVRARARRGSAVGDSRLEQQLRPRGRQVRLHPLRQLPEELHRRDSGNLGARRTRQRARQGKLLRRRQGQGPAGTDDLLPRLHRRPARDRSRPMSARASSPPIPSAWTAASR